MTTLKLNHRVTVRTGPGPWTSDPTITLAAGASVTLTAEQAPTLFPVNARPYTAAPWNTSIAAGAPLHAQSAAWIANLATQSTGKLRSDPTQYAFPVYFGDASSPRVDLIATGIASVQLADGTKAPSSKLLTGVPMPVGTAASSGSDAQIIVIDRVTGDEYDVWQFDGAHTCTNVTKYERGVYRSGTTSPVVYASRGAGVPYLAGLIRRWEVDAGKIEHALAFAYPNTSPSFVYPATKSDGHGTGMPEGTRLQLNPAFDLTTLTDPVARIIAKAMQVYGMFVVDTSGSNKVVPEDNRTANWGTLLTATTVSTIPIAALRVLA